MFANKQIVCVEYEELNADQEREIFQVFVMHIPWTNADKEFLKRVQLGVALTPAGPFTPS